MAGNKVPSHSDRVYHFRIFTQVAEMSSFIGAARALKLPPATVSAAIRTLENELGVRLFHRTTRQVKLSPDGERILPIARKIAIDLDEIYSLLGSSRDDVSGKLNVDAPSRIASKIIAPQLPSLLEKHPSLELNVSSRDYFINPIKEGIDCLIRVGDPRNDNLVCKPLGFLEMVNCASPAYLAAHGIPKHPDELVNHWLVGYLPDADMHPASWSCVDASGASRKIQMRHRIVVNSVESYLSCCHAGLGLIQIPRFDVRNQLLSGSLLEVLPDWPAGPMRIGAFYLHRSQRTPRLTAFIDWFQALLPHYMNG